MSTTITDPAAPLERRRRRASPKLVVGAALLAVFVLVGLLAPVIRPFDPLEQDLLDSLLPPGPVHWFGTDELGRDVFSRALSATSIDLSVAFLASLLPGVLGTALGLVAGYFGGVLDAVVIRIADLLQAFPMYILMIVLVFALGPGVPSLLVAFTAIGWIPYARLIRTEVQRIKGSEYITAAVTNGIPTLRILVLHVLPNSIRQSIVYFSSDVVFAVSALAAFSFLGFGVQQPTPEWGAMIAAGQPYLGVAWWLTVIPGLMLAVLALALALIGDALQERRDS